MADKRNMDKGVLTNIDMKRPRYKALYWTMLAILIIWSVGICVFPVVWVMLTGFKTPQEMYAIPATLFPENFELSKIVRVWNEMKFYKYYLSTFIMSAGAVVFTLVICGLGGYVLSRLKPRGSKIVFAVFFWLMLMPGTMRTVPLYMTFKDFPYLHINMLNSYLPIWLMAAADIFNIILFKNFFDGISNQILEAARVDGASNIRIFFQIILPLSLPVFWTVAIFTFNGNFGQFFWPFLLISEKEMTVLGVQLFNLKNSTFSMDYQMLALLFAMIPQLIIFAVFQRQIIGGVNVGGVKG
ncbi:MAG: carbohydrate ABC transporter permease [Clostridia bacterium]|nr:carbohydrate ABC transporter permease [Clostridia bacterium]